jgi:rhodanese-related sulfurtransferase
MVEKSSVLLLLSNRNFLDHDGLDGRLHFLIQGEVEFSNPMQPPKRLCAGEDAAYLPLEESLKADGSLQTVSACHILSVKTDVIDELLACGQSRDFSKASLSELKYEIPELNNDGDVGPDWLEIFCRSPIAVSLSASNLQELIRALSGIDRIVHEGEIVTQYHADCDYFYVIKEGAAIVEEEGQADISEGNERLGVGDYFGDEALVLNSMHNVSIRMTSDGVLAVLSRADFQDIVTDSLLKSMPSKSEIESIAEKSDCILDVRHIAEFQHGHTAKSKNMPIDFLRRHISKMDADKIYYITSDGGRRSILAAYLLRQVGLDAFCLEDSMDLTAEAEKEVQENRPYRSSSLSKSAK